MLRVMWQEVADVLEAVVLEKALALKTRNNTWLEVAKSINAAAPSSWPKSLGDGKSFNVSLKTDQLRHRFTRVFKPQRNREAIVGAARAKAVAILGRSQLYPPDPDTTLWNWCIPKMHQLVNTGKLSSLERSQAASRSRARAKTPGKQKAAKAAAATPAETPDSPVRKLDLPGVKRGGKGGRGKGGAIPMSVKVVARDLVVNCGVPVRKVPQVWATCYTGLVGEAPDPKALFTKGNLSDWIIDMSSAELLGDIDDFWAYHAKYPDAKLHIIHDATTRKTYEIGRDAKLMNYLASYFNTDLKKAVYFILSMRALPGGGSAAATARGLAVSMADTGAYVLKASAAEDEAFTVQVTEKGKGVLDDLGSDNTDSALNVAAELSKLTGEVHASYPCTTHMNALDGKNPLDKAFGKRPAAPTTKSFDLPNVLNVPAKAFYIWSKHRAIWELYWRKGKHLPKFELLMPVPDGQPGKWETMGPAFSYIVRHAPALRKLMVTLEYQTTNIDGHGTLHKDAGLLWRWLCDPELFFGVLAADAWFNNEIEPTYRFLRTPSSLHSASGPHFKRHEMPLLALKKLHTARTFSGADELDKNVQWTVAKAGACAQKQIPEAHKMLLDAAPRDEGTDTGRFVIPSQERERLLMAWASGYCTGLSTNWENHWSKFLEPPLIFGLATDDEIGAAFVRRLLAIVAPAQSAAAGLASALPLSTTPASDFRCASAAQLDKYVWEHTSHGLKQAGIKKAFKELKLDSAACMADWLKLADPAQRKDVDWTRATLPGVGPFFENKFFGGFHAQLVIEQLFSVYGQHIQPEQSMGLKESIVGANVRQADERVERMQEGMRAKPLTPAAREKLSAEQQHSGELMASDENRKQLELMCEQLLKRMKSTTAEDVAAGHAFAVKRKAAWKLLGKREQKAAGGMMGAKRAKGTAKVTTDPFSSARGEKRKADEASWLKEQEAAAAASPSPPSSANRKRRQI
jgi:hypothetical protein